MTAAQQQLPLFLVGIVSGTSAAGLFRFAFQLGQALQRLADMLSRALFAELADVDAREGGAAMRALFLRTSRMALIVGGVIMVVIVALGYPTLYLIGGAAAIEPSGVSFEPTLLSAGKPGTALAIRALAVLLLCASLWLLLPRFGATGAAAAMLVSTLFAQTLFRLVTHRLMSGNRPGHADP